MNIAELYQELILDHGTKPRNHYKLEPCSHSKEGFNPLCGDKVELYLEVAQDKVVKASFLGNGCAISQASASLLTEAIMGLTLKEALDLSNQFQQSVTNSNDYDLGKLNALQGVKNYPMRVKCATLPWHTLEAALK